MDWDEYHLKIIFNIIYHYLSIISFFHLNSYFSSFSIPFIILSNEIFEVNTFYNYFDFIIYIKEKKNKIASLDCLPNSLIQLYCNSNTVKDYDKLIKKYNKN